MSEYTDQVIVLRGHLEDLERALGSAYGIASALDLQRGYLNMKVERESSLTVALGQQLERVRGYLETDVPEG